MIEVMEPHALKSVPLPILSLQQEFHFGTAKALQQPHNLLCLLSIFCIQISKMWIFCVYQHSLKLELPSIVGPVLDIPINGIKNLTYHAVSRVRSKAYLVKT